MFSKISFYNETITILLPNNFVDFKKEVGKAFGMEEKDYNELLYFSLSPVKIEITNKDIYGCLLKENKLFSIGIEVSEKSQLFLQTEKKLSENIAKKDCKNNINILGEFTNSSSDLTEQNPKIKEKEQLKEIQEQKIVHNRVRCDGCNMYPIVGIRYKCTVCQNFDYCENCEKKFSESHQHPFLKIRKPQLAPEAIKCYIKK